MYSALELGAEFVQGIDSEAKTIERGEKLFQQLEVEKSRYDLQIEDAFYYLENIEKGSFDTVFCLGTLYYMVEPYRLLKLMQKVAKEAVLIDTLIRESQYRLVLVVTHKRTLLECCDLIIRLSGNGSLETHRQIAAKKL